MASPQQHKSGSGKLCQRHDDNLLAGDGRRQDNPASKEKQEQKHRTKTQTQIHTHVYTSTSAYEQVHAIQAIEYQATRQDRGYDKTRADAKVQGQTRAADGGVARQNLRVGINGRAEKGCPDPAKCNAQQWQFPPCRIRTITT